MAGLGGLVVDGRIDADTPHALALLRARRTRPSSSAAKCKNKFAPPDADCHATFPCGSMQRRGRYHNWTCCAARFQSGPCRFGVKTRMLLGYRYVSSFRLRTCRCPQPANRAEGGEQCYTQMILPPKGPDAGLSSPR